VSAWPLIPIGSGPARLIRRCIWHHLRLDEVTDTELMAQAKTGLWCPVGHAVTEHWEVLHIRTGRVFRCSLRRGFEGWE
jgi:hypothetical protein